VKRLAEILDFIARTNEKRNTGISGIEKDIKHM